MGKQITIMETDYIKPTGSCRAIKDLSGQKFGRLTVMKFSHMAAGRGSFWLCACDCGKQSVSSRNSLLRGSIKSCGCLNIEMTIATHVLPNGQGCFNRTYNGYKQAAKSKGRDFELTREEFKSLIDDDCHYCGCAPFNTMRSRTHGDDYKYNGIDRKDNSLGYIVSNCVTACAICNQAKHRFSYDEFMVWINRITSFRNSHGD